MGRSSTESGFALLAQCRGQGNGKDGVVHTLAELPFSRHGPPLLSGQMVYESRARIELLIPSMTAC
jgi:hypothetical protein